MWHLGRILLTNLVVLQASIYGSKDSETIAKLSPCVCKYQGHIYNLSSLAKKDGERFRTSVNKYEYSYNPCIPFTKDLSTECRNVAICYWSDDGQVSDAIGFQSNVKCEVKNGIVELVYEQRGTRLGFVSTVQLKCNQSKLLIDDAEMKVLKDYGEPILQVEHKCCCPDGCPTKTIPTVGPIVKPTSSLVQTSSNRTDIWEPVVGAIGGIVLVLMSVTYCYRKCQRIPNRRRGYGAIANRDGVRRLAPIIDNNYNDDGDNEGGREGVEDEEDVMRDVPRINGMVAPMVNNREEEDGGREGVEHEEEFLNASGIEDDALFGVPENRLTNPTQVSEQDPDSNCCREYHLFPASSRNQPQENLHKV